MRAAAADIEAYVDAGWWEPSQTLSATVRDHAQVRPDLDAYRWGETGLTWSEYDRLADDIASAIASVGAVGERVVVWMPDTGLVHAAYLGCERANVVAVGVGWRAGRQELEHLVEVTDAAAAILPSDTQLGDAQSVAASLGIAAVWFCSEQNAWRADSTGSSVREAAARTAGPSGGEIGPSDLWLLNSTSGTTGRPKCVMQTQNRWFYFHQKAVAAGRLGTDFGHDETWMSVVPAPFGFGLWTAHVTPTLLGVPCIVQPRFDAVAAAAAIEEHGVTVLAAVSSQFVMILDAAGGYDLSSLRVVFTGGEAISPTRAAALESQAGCTVLNFYGSNETGMLSGTTIEDAAEHRYLTGGRVVPEMNVRLYEPTTGERIPGDRGRGQPASNGPAHALGYWNDEAANEALRTDDGWFLMGDIVEIDDDGYLAVVGRTSDIVIRGGKNISAVAVEEEVATHPAVGLVAVVGAPHPRLGETAVAFVQLRPSHALTLDDLKEHLAERGVTIEWWPERLVVMDALPVSSGGKVAKSRLRDLARQSPT